jgi:4-amino-4-deoxy-L-arabinose transferase-like glycosyltransferase
MLIDMDVEKLLKFIISRRFMLALFGLMVISLIFQLHNLSSYNVYPDSYQSLVVAKNLRLHHMLVAPMGRGGLIYPGFFSWTRPGYPIFIVLISYLGFSFETSAHIIAIVAGVMSVLVSYLLVKEVFRSSKAGLCAAILLTFSYANNVWSGFILTEPLGLLTLSLALWSLFIGQKAKDDWLETADIRTGLLFSLAILTRYEYLAIFIPAAFLIKRRFSVKRSLTVLIISIMSTLAVLIALQSLAAGWSLAWNQTRGEIVILLIELFVLGVIALIHFKVKDLTTYIKPISRIFAVVIVVAVLSLLIRHSIYLGLWLFIKHDSLISLASLVGIVSLLLDKNKKYQKLGLGLIFGSTILGVSYYHTNPTMERYLTHMLPLLLIAAVRGVQVVLNFKYRIVSITALILLLGFQVSCSWQGLHGVDNNIWFKSGYEEVVAKRLAPIFGNNSTVVTAFPEPYYMYTNATIQNVSNYKPYVYLNDNNTNQTIFVVNDLSMQEAYPNAYNMINDKLGHYQVAEGIVRVPLRYEDKIIYSSTVLKVYKLRTNQLQYLLSR